MSKKNTQKEIVNAPSKVYNFCSKKKLILGVVIAVLVVFLAGAVIRGIHLAIEFKGGTLITYTYQGDIDTNEVGNTVKDIVGSSVVVRTGESLDSGGKQLTISFTSDQGLTADRQTAMTNALKEKFPDNSLEIYDSNDVLHSCTLCSIRRYHLYRYPFQKYRRLVSRCMLYICSLPRYTRSFHNYDSMRLQH